LGTSVVAVLALAGCKKAPEVAAPPEGWFQSPGSRAACYYPKNYDALGTTDRRIARQQALDAMLSQWKGGRNDGVTFDEKMIEQVETTLLGEPNEIEATSAENAKFCETFMTTGSTDGWFRWLDELPERLTAGECKHPLVNRYFNYVDIASGWQNRVGVCAGAQVQITVSSIDMYRIDDKGPWINVDGDPAKPAHATDLPCNLEGCFAGQLLLRFTPDGGGAGVIAPLGHSLTYTPPGHGYIEVMVNDNSWPDNRYKVEKGLEHHASIEYAPK
jgi:hypothetical protein